MTSAHIQVGTSFGLLFVFSFQFLHPLLFSDVAMGRPKTTKTYGSRKRPAAREKATEVAPTPAQALQRAKKDAAAAKKRQQQGELLIAVLSSDFTHLLHVERLENDARERALYEKDLRELQERGGPEADNESSHEDGEEDEADIRPRKRRAIEGDTAFLKVMHMLISVLIATRQEDVQSDGETSQDEGVGPQACVLF